MRFQPFDHAAFLAKSWQAGAPRHNLAASGFQPAAPLDGLAQAVQPDDVTMLDLHAGTPFQAAAAKHVQLAAEAVLPTAGTSAANLCVIAALARPGTNVVSERPYYAPLPYTAQGLGAVLRFVDRSASGSLDPDAVIAAMDNETSLVLITSPNNPTGHTDDDASLIAIAEAAQQHDAWVLVDQVYAGLSHGPVAAKLHPRLITTGGLNKCWGAPGLRAGWVAGAAEVLAEIEDVHRLFLLGPSRLGTRLATQLLAQAPARRQALQERLAATHPLFEAWAERHDLPLRHGDLIALVPAPVKDTASWAHALARQGILALPGEVFGRPGHIRIGLGIEPQALQQGLAALSTHWTVARS